MAFTNARERRWAWLGLVLVWAAWPTGWVHGQGSGKALVTRVQRTRQILRPVFDAPASIVRRLSFSGSGDDLWLYCAGDDKLTHRWKLTPDGDGVRLDGAEPIVWPIHGDVRGMIYALDVQRQSSGDLVAFGGIGLKGPEVCLSVAGLPASQQILMPAEQQDLKNAYVYAVDVSDDGSQLAVAHDLSEPVRLWRLSSGKAAKLPLNVNTGLTVCRWLRFNPSGSRLAVAGFDDKGVWFLRVYRADNGQRTASIQLFGVITGLGWRGDDRWLAARHNGDKAEQNGVIEGAADSSATRQLVGGEPATTMAAGGSLSVLALATLISSGGGQVQLHDSGGRKTSTLRERFAGPVTALAISPDEDYVAAAGVVDLAGRRVNQIRIWRVNDGRLVAESPDEAKAAVMGGPIARVAVIQTPPKPGSKVRPADQIAFAWGAFQPDSAGPPPSHQFRLLFRDRIAESTARPADQTLGRVLRRASSGDWYVVDANRPKDDPWGPLPKRGANVPRAFAVLRSSLLAVGYTDGIMVLKHGDWKLIRGFFGHAGNVNSLAFAADGTWLASGAEDGTICAWDLSDMGTNELGLSLARNDRNRLVVAKDPTPDAPAWEAGFERGQIIESLNVDGQTVTGMQPMFNALRSATPGKVIEATVHTSAGRGTLTTRALHDPLWTLYPQQDGEWCLYTPDGQFDCSPGCLDRLRWHVNLNGGPWLTLGGVGESARLFDLADFQDLYRDSDHSVLDAAVGGKRVPRVVDDVPPPRLDLDVDEQRLSVRFSAEKARHEIVRVSVWLNGHKMAEQDGTSLSARLPEDQLRRDANMVVGVATLRVGQGTVDRTVVRQLGRQGPATPGKLHFLGIGVTALDHADEHADAQRGTTVQPLRFADRDVLAFAAALRRDDMERPAGAIMTLVHGDENGGPTEANIRDKLAELAAAAAPNDLAIVMLAGHGLDGDAGKPFRFIAQDTRQGRGVTDAQINEALARLPCRALLVLDTCHSGEEAQKQQLRNWPGLGLGPLVLAACRSNESSNESDSLGFDDDNLGHGLLTAALLEPLVGRRALDGVRDLPDWDRDGDGQLALGEWRRYLEERSAQLVEELTVDAQHPTVIRSVTFKDADRFVLMPALPQP